MIGVGVMAYALVAQTLSDKAEQSLGYTPTEQDKERLREMVPRISSVDRIAAKEGREK